MIEMRPDLLSPDIKSGAEAALFSEFREFHTDKRYIILHSLGVADHVNKIFGEIDFVVICEKGILCIEVKGGRVQCNQGIWTFTNRFGKTTRRSEGPFQQVQGNMQSLRNYMARRLGRQDDLVLCQYASCVIMPECTFEYDGIEIIPEILFDRNNFVNLDQVVEESFAYWSRQLRAKHGFEGGLLDNAEMDRMANLLRGDFQIVPSLKESVDDTAKALSVLTIEQYDVLESLADNDRTLVAGVAGAGKTMLAMEQARRIYWAGQRVLYVCFNKNIADYVRFKFEKENLNIDVQTLHSILADGKVTDNPSENYFENILPSKFMEIPVIRQFDYLVVDEGQDLFKEQYICCLSRLVTGGLEQGRWLMLYDMNQNLYNDSKQANRILNQLRNYGAATFKLTVNCRNTRQISDANTLVSGIVDTAKPKIDGISVEYRPYGDKKEELEILENILSELRNEGICGGDLILLSKYAITNSNNCLSGYTSKKLVGTLKTEGQIWRAKKTETRFSTISAFKGLEAKAVILLDVDSFSDNNSRLLNYVAISRAEAMLYMLYDVNKENERQDMMIGKYEW